ncbi:MAG: hypothetical protein ACJAYR_002376 [Sneathiella sp.]|jgi:hypothetical protein
MQDYRRILDIKIPLSDNKMFIFSILNIICQKKHHVQYNAYDEKRATNCSENIAQKQ